VVGQADDGERLLRGVARVSFDIDAPEPREETQMVSACVEINQCVGCTDNSSLSHLTAMARLSWLGRAARNRHRHAIEQASRRWRGGRRDDSARTRRKILISTQVGAASADAGKSTRRPESSGSAFASAAAVAVAGVNELPRHGLKS